MYPCGKTVTQLIIHVIQIPRFIQYYGGLPIKNIEGLQPPVYPIPIKILKGFTPAPELLSIGPMQFIVFLLYQAASRRLVQESTSYSSTQLT